MSLTVNNNLMSAFTARSLNAHYARLGVSTHRLSSGLRINSAADDAAGLAIRELQRADISTLRQGARNANDAVSLIQVADGALGIIDEKLIRMRELAEQAATGTYDSTQRLMIESEYQAMASEIQRIAMATDFNGIKLLDGNLESRIHDGSKLDSKGKLKVHFGTGNDSAEDYYYVQIEEAGSHALSIGSGSTFHSSMDRLEGRVQASFEEKFGPMYQAGLISEAEYKDMLDLGKEMANITRGYGDPQSAEQFVLSYKNIYGKPIIEPPNPPDLTYYTNPIGPIGPPETNHPDDTYKKPEIPGDTWNDKFAYYQTMNPDEKEKVKYLFGREAAHIYNDDYLRWIDAGGDPVHPPGNKVLLPANVTPAMVQTAIGDPSKWYLDRHDFAGLNIKTHENAQIVLEAVNKAIVIKDKIRANLGAVQNRLENTITNLNIQAENLQAAESRISDVDVGTEMTQFVRNQILTQSAVAMLAQANALPKMAMQLIGG